MRVLVDGVETVIEGEVIGGELLDVFGLTERGIRVEFKKENLVFTGEDSHMANLLLSVMGATAEFERQLIRERQREGIALAKKRRVYRGRSATLGQKP